MSADQRVQTDFNRTVTFEVRDNLDSLYNLLDKLYRRNPREWRKTGVSDQVAAVARVKHAIQERGGGEGARPAGLRDIRILAVSLDSDYSGDRVGAFIYGLADTLIAAHNGKTHLYATDVLDGRRAYNTARNVEATAWLAGIAPQPPGCAAVAGQRDISTCRHNPSFEREFGAIIGRLDLIANLLGENSRRIGINYAQDLLLFNLLPMR